MCYATVGSNVLLTRSETLGLALSLCSDGCEADKQSHIQSSFQFFPSRWCRNHNGHYKTQSIFMLSSYGLVATNM